METMTAIRKRKSYRGTFKPGPMPRADLKEILEAGTLAPSGCNLQTTQFIGVDDPGLLGDLGEIYGREWAKTAAGAVLLLTKETPSRTGVSYHVQDYSAAAQSICLAATAKGYSTVWIEGQILGEKAAQMGKLLHVPGDMAVAIYLPMGVPTQDAPGPAKKPFGEKAWFNQYGGDSSTCQ